MTRKKSPNTEYHRRARLKVRISFDGFVQGQEFEVRVDPLVAGWIEIGVVEIVEELGGPYGEDAAGPGSVESDVPSDEQE
jgi:hypothetical protein